MLATDAKITLSSVCSPEHTPMSYPDIVQGEMMAAQEPSPPSSLEGNKPGFPKKILSNNLKDKHLCNSCQKILRRPLQAQCGHRFCSFCFNNTVSSGPQKCSACIKEDLFEEHTSILKQGGAFPDNAARREVEALAAVCPNEGCTWMGTIKEFEASHEGDCDFMIILCPSCKELMRANEQERHNERECPERTLNCKYCKEPFLLKNIKAHDEICPKYPMICEGCAKKKIPREKYVDHIKFCSKFKSPCRFHVVGCDTSVEKEKIHDHERQCSYEHLNLLLHFIMGIKVSLESLQPQSLDVTSHKLQELHQSLRDSVGATLELQLQGEKTKVVELSRRCQELELKVSTFENIVCVLNREMEYSCTTMEAYNHQHRLDQDKIEILNNKVRQLERTVSLRDLSIVEMEGKMREMSAATYDGIFVWKIWDFTKKRQDAVAGRAPAMFSPAFYTSKYGYKMCLRIYLNGDGTGRGTHLSLFFVVMRGHSDALLKWPFNQKVTLMLLDQNNREHIIDAFRPDISSSSFQRPVSDMNIASGCPLFCSLSKLDSKNSYIRDDTIFIKAIVDLTGL
ncbi:putative TNF receptor-associated factor 2-like [Scophthalmus maximus]|uniref:TNF receptor-associated factor n=1 Tax=Scophthalmus maximus TaxID=52904 RepID=A0A2U9BS96_SCOMX|nr:putative TNF receptor-associated factor 2-like [Scophthalmus maximus]